MRYFHQDTHLISDRNLHLKMLQDFNPFQNISIGFEVGLNFDFFLLLRLCIASSQDPPSCPRICNQSWISNLWQGVGALTDCIFSTYCLNLRERKMFSEKSHLFSGQTHANTTKTKFLFMILPIKLVSIIP